LADAVDGGVLDLACNGEIDYRLRGIRVRQRAEWGPREPEGGGDVVGARLRGNGAAIRIIQGPETGYHSELHVEETGSGGLEGRLRAALGSWREVFPGLDLAASDIGFRLLIPDALRIGHEAQFPLVLDDFLDLVEAGGWPERLAGRIRSRYTLLARAHERAVAAG
jgi:hypothetical protein